MNKLTKIIFYILICPLFITSCKGVKGNIDIEQFNTDYKIVINTAKNNSRIVKISFPQKIKIKNTTWSKEIFLIIDYDYKDSLSSWANRNIELYTINNQKLKRISNNNKKTILPKKSLEYVFYTRHFVDSTKATQQQFTPYIAKILAENKDTLHIGTVQEFKQKHKALFERLTKNDSISIQFLDGKKLGERITVPVVW